jgi:hypothetical protein
MAIAKATVNWTNFIGAPGYTNLYFRDFQVENTIDQAIVDGFVAKLDLWLDAWVSSVPLNISFVVNPTVDVIDETNGQLTDFFTATPDPTRSGASSGNYSAASGACVNWYTNAVRNGRRIRGRSFMVPLGQTALATDGSIDNTRIASLRAATATFIDGTGTGDLGVWARPTAPGATDGEWAFASSFTLPDKVAVLRSRRD